MFFFLIIFKYVFCWLVNEVYGKFLVVVFECIVYVCLLLKCER